MHNDSEYARGLLTVRQVCELANVSPNTLHQWRRAGRIRPVAHAARDKRLVLYRRGDVVRLIHGVCPWCGTPFQRTSLQQHFCAPACRKNAHRLARETEGKGAGGPTPRGGVAVIG